MAALTVAGGALVVLPAPALAHRMGHARHKDHTPPKFGGLKSAVTCIPGPTGPGRESSYHLSWEAASDDVTPSSKIVYEVYQASSLGGENFARPTYTTVPGATSFSTPRLPAERSFFFVVRARDRARNEDKNTVEREGQNLCV